VNVVLRRVGRIVRRPVHHRESAALERHEIEEAAALFEGETVLHLDQPSGSRPVFENTLLDLHRPVRRTDQKTRRFGHRVTHPLEHGP
jgi:hypothetical protein